MAVMATEVYQAIKFPLALSGARTGVHRVLRDYNNAVLKQRRLQQLASPKYALDYCHSLHESLILTLDAQSCYCFC